MVIYVSSLNGSKRFGEPKGCGIYYQLNKVRNTKAHRRDVLYRTLTKYMRPDS